MSKSQTDSQPPRIVEEMTMYIAMVVRNSMDDFHSRHLSDDQMKELNPLIRNAICTALHAAGRLCVSKGAEAFVNFHTRMIPAYWENPVILEDFRAMEARLDAPSTEEA